MQVNEGLPAYIVAALERQLRRRAGGQSWVTKSISSSTRPSSAGSRSWKPRTPPRMCFHARAMSAWSRCGQPNCWQTPCFHSMLRGHLRPRLLAEPLGLDRGPDVDERVADDQHVLADRGLRDRLRRSGSPSSRAPGGRRVRRPGARVPGRKSRSFSPRSSTPSRYSTTTPSIRRSSPHTFSTSSASCRPSTKIRLARATRALHALDGDRP